MYMYVKLHVLLHIYDAHVFSEPKPPPKKAKSEDSDYDGVSHLLQGEIARLRHHFVVDLDPLYHNQSKAVHLICKLGLFLLETYHCVSPASLIVHVGSTCNCCHVLVFCCMQTTRTCRPFLPSQ